MTSPCTCKETSHKALYDFIGGAEPERRFEPSARARRSKPIPAFEPDGEVMAVVTPDHAAVRIEQRTARISPIRRRIGLDRIGYLATRARWQTATERVDHACRE